MATFGYTTQGTGGSIAWAASRITGEIATSPANAGILTKITAYINITPAGNAKAVLYQWNGGTNATKIDTSSPVAIGTTSGWVDFTMNNVSLSPNTQYIICIVSDTSNANINFDDPAVGINSAFQDNSYTSPGSPLTFSNTRSRNSSIYATYTPAIIGPFPTHLRV